MHRLLLSSQASSEGVSHGAADGARAYALSQAGSPMG